MGFNRDNVYRKGLKREWKKIKEKVKSFSYYKDVRFYIHYEENIERLRELGFTVETIYGINEYEISW